MSAKPRTGPPLTPAIAIISGGLGDIGRAIVRELAQRGADIAVGDVVPASRAAALLAEIRGLGRRGRYDRVDVSDAAAVAHWVRVVEQSLGTPTWIIPNAAIVTTASLRHIGPAEWRRELAINLDGAFHLAQAAALRLVRRKRPGRIVLIGSWAGEVAHAGIPSYCVSKAGLRMLGKLLAREFAADDILVNEVAPGYVDAGLSGKLFERNPRLRVRARRRVPTHKLIQPAEVARQVAHLCDPANQQMTGSVLLMDGGLSLLTL